MFLTRPLCLAILLLILLPLGALDFWDEAPVDVLASELAGAMDDQELLGQVLLLGYQGASASRDILRLIGRRNTGGIKIFGWNVKDLPTLAEAVSRMQRESQTTRFRIPLLVVTDQEGGWVRHVRSGTSETPGNLALGASNIPQDAYLTGYYIGLEMKALGINMNFAPTVDIYTNPEAHIIGPRAFGDDPVRTGVLATAFFKGMDASGVIATAKHFPGHGNADADSHSALPIIPADWDTLWTTDLVPYRLLIREEIPAIMSGHLAFPNITGNLTPASLSSQMIRELTREKMGFQGIIVTDDLIMEGVQHLPYDTATITRLALEAGNDLILISRPPELHERIYILLLDYMKNHPEFRETVRESARRVLELKLRYLKREDAVPLYPALENLDRLIPAADGSDFFTDHAFRSVTPLRGDIPFPLPETTGSVLMVSQYDEFFEEGQKFFPGADRFSFSYAPFYYAENSELRRFQRAVRGYDTILFCLANPNSLEMLKTLESFPGRVQVFSVLTPLYLTQVPWVKRALALYGTSKASFFAGFSASTGIYNPPGVLPLSVNLRGD